MVTIFFEVYFALLGHFVFFCRATAGCVGQFLSAVDTWSSNKFFLKTSRFGCGYKLSFLSGAGFDNRKTMTFHDFDVTIQDRRIKTL